MDRNEINMMYTYLDSEQTTQNYLYQCYQLLEVENADVKSYENCQAFMYYLEHSSKYYQAGENNDIALKPVLLFYGMVHLLKAVLLTIRPDYPESTSHLAHGVSTRKRKKKNYFFLEDEVKVQHHGLFPYFSQHLYSIKTLPFEKISMGQLMCLIPELQRIFQYQQQNCTIAVGKYGTNQLHFPITMLDSYHWTDNQFLKRLENFLGIKDKTVDDEHITIFLKEPLTSIEAPFYYHMDNESVHFPESRDIFQMIPEVMIHYLLLYNLSMISRYESEWWGDLLHSKSDVDYPLIQAFLDITAKKIPLILGNQLLQQIKNG